jgi:integrase/recombinase XerD
VKGERCLYRQPVTIHLRWRQAWTTLKPSTCLARNYSNRTREEYESDITDLSRFLITHGIKNWLVVGLRDLQAYMAELDRRGLEPSSRNRKTYSIKTFFAYLHQSSYVRKDVSRELIPPTVPHKERRFLREEEYQAILAAAHSSRDRVILTVFLRPGVNVRPESPRSIMS